MVTPPGNLRLAPSPPDVACCSSRTVTHRAGGARVARRRCADVFFALKPAAIAVASGHAYRAYVAIAAMLRSGFLGVPDNVVNRFFNSI